MFLNDRDISENETEDIDIVTSYIIATHNHRWKHFSLGYGLSFNYNEWRKVNTLYDIYGHYAVGYGKLIRYGNIGAVINARFYFNNLTYMEASYRPSFISFGKGKTLDYEHLISISLGLKIKLTNRK